jgi:hypothetical protein
MGDASYKIAIEKFDADKVNQKLMNILDYKCLNVYLIL